MIMNRKLYFRYVTTTLSKQRTRSPNEIVNTSSDPISFQLMPLTLTAGEFMEEGLSLVGFMKKRQEQVSTEEQQTI